MLTGILCLLLFEVACDLPSDATLIAQFHRSSADLERLREMADKDDIRGRIHADYADPKLPVARLDEYRRLMKAGGVMRTYADGTGRPLEFVVDANGFLAQVGYKGFLYSPAESARSQRLSTTAASVFRKQKDRNGFVVRSAAWEMDGGCFGTNISEKAEHQAD